MKVQSFSSFSLDELTKSVNTFCLNNNIKDIQYQTVQVIDTRYSDKIVYRTKYTAFIIYIVDEI